MPNDFHGPIGVVIGSAVLHGVYPLYVLVEKDRHHCARRQCLSDSSLKEIDGLRSFLVCCAKYPRFEAWLV